MQHMSILSRSNLITNSRKIDTDFLRLSPFLPQHIRPFLTPHSNRYTNQPPYHNQKKKRKQAPGQRNGGKGGEEGNIQQANGFAFDSAPGTNPSVVKSTGIIFPFSSLACSILNPQSNLAKFKNILRSATQLPGQIRRPPPKVK